MPTEGGRRIATTLFGFAVVAAIAIACNAILDNKDAEYVASGDAGCTTGYVCGRACVQPGDPAYGCQIGASCQACPGVAHGTRGCDDAGSCGIASCDPPFAQCDPGAEGGCETNLESSPAHCGACGNACAPGSTCADGGCVSGCPYPKTQCGAIGCFDIKNDPTHCGQSCSELASCPAGPNATPVCNQGTCMIVCDVANYLLCGGRNGIPPYCAEVSSDPDNCGACGNSCGGGGNGCLEGKCCVPGPAGPTDCCYPPGTQENCLAENFCCSGTCDPQNNVCQ